MQTQHFIACRQDTIVRDPFYEEVPTFFHMSLKELYSLKHPTAWLEFERGEIGEEALVSRFFRDGRAFDSIGMKRMMVSCTASLAPSLSSVVAVKRCCTVVCACLSPIL